MEKRPAKRARRSRPRSPLVDLLHPNQYAPVRSVLMNLLDTQSVLRLCQTSHEIRNWIRSEDWNINAKLASFMRDPLAFRGQLRRSDAFITGIFPLEFLGRIPTSGGMGIVVQPGKNMESMVKYLTKQEGYKKKVPKLTEYCYFEKRCSAYGIRRVTLISVDVPIHRILEHTVTSAMFAFISWNKAYALFPWTTFIDREAIPTRGQDDWHKGVRAYLQRIGIPLRTYAVDKMPAGGNPELLVTRRRVGDRLTWQLVLDTALLPTEPSTPDYVVEHACFSVAEPKHRLTGWNAVKAGLPYKITATRLVSNALRYKYTIGVVDSQDDPQDDVAEVKIRAFLEQSTLNQLSILDSKTREKLVGNKSPTEIDDEALFEKPEDWEYSDDKMPHMMQWWARAVDEESDA